MKNTSSDVFIAHSRVRNFLQMMVRMICGEALQMELNLIQPQSMNSTRDTL